MRSIFLPMWSQQHIFTINNSVFIRKGQSPFLPPFWGGDQNFSAWNHERCPNRRHFAKNKVPIPNNEPKLATYTKP